MLAAPAWTADDAETSPALAAAWERMTAARPWLTEADFELAEVWLMAWSEWRSARAVNLLEGHGAIRSENLTAQVRMSLAALDARRPADRGGAEAANRGAEALFGPDSGRDRSPGGRGRRPMSGLAGPDSEVPS